MELTFGQRLKHAWNAFQNRDPTYFVGHNEYMGYSSSYRPDKARLGMGREKSIIASIYNRISIDVAAIEIRHVRLDQNGSYKEDIDSRLNECLTVEANMDQTGRSLIQDIVLSMFDEGCVAVLPVEADFDPTETGSYEIYKLRTGKILEWYPSNVRVKSYNELTGQHEELLVPKKMVAIIENPLYTVMNEPNSTLQRLIRKLNLLDTIDEQNGSNKLDLIIQLPYTIRSAARREQANRRLKDIEMQLTSTKYGIAYADATEHIIQLNRAVENNMLPQVEYLTKMLYNQLGMTEEVFNGTADEQTQLNYYSKTIEPILSAIVEEMKRKWLTKTARTQGQSIMYFRNPFKLISVENVANVADTFTRNEIMTSNEIRAIIGMKPSSDPAANELRNKNLNQSNNESKSEASVEEPIDEELTEVDILQAIADLDNLDAQLDELESGL